MKALDENFPFPNDCLYMTEPKKESPPKYLYAHWDNNKEVGFIAYFESLQSNEPMFMSLTNNCIVYPNDLDGLLIILAREMTEFNANNEKWKQKKAIKALLPSFWKQLFQMKKEELIKGQENEI